MQRPPLPTPFPSLDSGGAGGAASTASSPTIVGRYAIHDAIASGGMATVHLGRLIGEAGFSRTVAIKRLHPQFAHDKELANMLLDEAKLAARIQHPNVVPTLDVVVLEQELLLVMEYVRGDSLSRLLRAAKDNNIRLPPGVVVAIMSNVLAGLHAAHEATDERGQPLGLIHRDVSPQNVMVGVDGTARVLDFGIAKAEGRLHTTRDGEIKGKVLYMAREQLAAEPLTRATDIYAAGIILHEALTGERMFAGENEAAAVSRIVANDLRVPSQIDPTLGAFDSIVRRASALDPSDRYASAQDMARDLEQVCAATPPRDVGQWVEQLAATRLDVRARIVAEIERSSRRSLIPGIARPPSHHHEDVITSQPTSGIQSVKPAATRASITGPAMPVASAPAMVKVRFTTIAIVVVSISLLLATIGIAGIYLSQKRAAAVPPVIVAAPTTAASAEPDPTTTATATTPVASVATADTPPPPKPTRVVVTTTPPAAPRTKTTTAKRCDPPYTVDKNGHKHFLPECVE